MLGMQEVELLAFPLRLIDEKVQQKLDRCLARIDIMSATPVFSPSPPFVFLFPSFRTLQYLNTRDGLSPPSKPQ